MLTIYFKDGTKRSFDEESNILIKETIINTEIKSILTFDYIDEDYFGSYVKRTGVFFTDEMFGFCKESKQPETKQKVIIDVNDGKYILKGLNGFRALEDSNEKEAIKVETADVDDFNSLKGELSEFWFDENSKYTQLGVSDVDVDGEKITIYCTTITGAYFLDRNNNKIRFKDVKA